MRPGNHRPAETSHTLLEVLLVIGCIGVIYSMYISSLALAKRMADMAVCRHYRWEMRTLAAMPEHNRLVDRIRVFNRCYDCHASAP